MVLQPEDILNLLVLCELLEQTNDALKHMLEDEVIEHEANEKGITDLQYEIKHLRNASR